MASTFTNLLYHIVFSTKDRIPKIHEGLRDRLYEYIGGIIRGKEDVCWRSEVSPTMFISWLG